MHTDWSCLHLSGSQKLDPPITLILILCIRVVVPKRAGPFGGTSSQTGTDLGLAVVSKLFDLWFSPTRYCLQWIFIHHAFVL